MKWSHLLVLCAIAFLGVGCLSPDPILRRPRVAGQECQLGGYAGDTCCDASMKPCLTLGILRAEDFCTKYLRTCSKQPDGHCNWSSDEVSREQQCVDIRSILH